MIKLTGVTVEFDSGAERVTALSEVDLAVTPGEFVVLHGMSGSGKSTLLNVVAGLEKVTRGSIRVDDIIVDRESEKVLAAMRLKHVGIVFQDNNLIAEFNATENVEFPLRARGHDPRQSRAESDKALRSVGLGDLGRRRPSQLSGGQKQRVGIARAIAGGKNYLLADEPTGALDSVTSVEIFKMMRNLADEGYGVVVASHDPRAGGWADREVELLDGRVIADVRRTAVETPASV